MAYERQYYTNGDVLDARQMNHMETGIKENSDNIDKHSEDIATKASAIKEKASGEVIVVTDSDEAKPLGLAIDGKSEQKQYSGKNFLKINGQTTMSKDGVTCDINNDGIVILNGTATAQNAIVISSKELLRLVPNTYVLNGCPVNGETLGYRIQIWNIDGNGTFASDRGNGKEFEFTNESTDYNISIGFDKGATFSNLVFEPMIRFASVTDGTFEPYVGGKPSPSPEYKQEIRNIGVYDEASGKYAVGIVGTKKNKLNSKKLKEQTMNGITYTPVKDENGLLEYVEVNGAATKTSSYEILTDLKKGKYILNGCPSGGETSTYTIQCKKNNTSGYAFGEDRGLNGLKFVLDEETTIDAYIRIGSGTVCNGLRFYPMIRLEEITDDTYEPWQETTATVLLDEPLYGVPVLSGGNYTDQNGQQWICDEFVKYADGTGEKIQRVEWFSGQPYLSSGMCFVIVPPKTPMADTICISDKFKNIDLQAKYSNEMCCVFDEKIWCRSDSWNPNKDKTPEDVGVVNYVYALAEPIRTPLTAEQIAEIEKLSMFYPTTILSNDCNANMEVTYIADTKAYIDKKFAELATAMV